MSPLQEDSQLPTLDAQSSKEGYVIIFKHSTRCIISGMAKRRLEKEWRESMKDLPVYYLDIIRHKALSNAVAEHYNVRHESPQLLLIRNGKCEESWSHEAISADGVWEKIQTYA